MWDEKTQKLATTLFDIGAIKFGAFKLKLHERMPDAPLSPIYIDLRLLRSFPDALDLAVSVYRELAGELEYDVYADVPTAATPIVAVLSHETRVPMITPRTDSKGHGTLGSVDGVFTPGSVALLVDDLITSADSKLEAAAILAENGVVVHDIVVLIDREQGGPENLMNRGYRCHAAFQLTDLLDFYLGTRKITQRQYEETRSYLEK